MKAVFMGTSSFAIPCLQALLDNKLEVLAVYTQPPRRAGRGKKIRLSPVGHFAVENNLELLYPKNFLDPYDIQVMKTLKPDVVLVVAYGLILPEQLLAVSKIGFFNVHASILPRWRGAAPIQRALLSDDKKTGVSIMKLEKGLDSGPIVFVQDLKIKSTDNAGLLHEKLSLIGADLSHKLCKNVHRLKPKRQNKEGVTYARKIEKSETQIDWANGANFVDRQIRAFSPTPGAWFDFGGERIKILECEIGNGEGPPGFVLDNHFQVACGTGSIFPTVLQRAGKLPNAVEVFRRGYKIPIGMTITKS